MENLRNAVLFGCCAAFGLTLAELILPLERFTRQIRLLTAILMMTVILTPLTKLDLSDFTAHLSDENPQASDLIEAAAEMQEQAAAERICNALNRELAEKQVNCRVTEVCLHIQQDGCISINEVKAEGNLLTGTVFLREWLGNAVTITEGGTDLASDG